MDIARMANPAVAGPKQREIAELERLAALFESHAQPSSATARSASIGEK